MKIWFIHECKTALALTTELNRLESEKIWNIFTIFKDQNPHFSDRTFTILYYFTGTEAELNEKIKSRNI